MSSHIRKAVRCSTVTGLHRADSTGVISTQKPFSPTSFSTGCHFLTLKMSLNLCIDLDFLAAGLTVCVLGNDTWAEVRVSCPGKLLLAWILTRGKKILSAFYLKFKVMLPVKWSFLEAKKIQGTTRLSAFLIVRLEQLCISSWPLLPTFHMIWEETP